MRNVSYYSFDVDGDGRHTGLIRRLRDDAARTLEDQRIDDLGNWITDPSLERHFREGYDLVPIDEDEAASLAARYGGTL